MAVCNSGIESLDAAVNEWLKDDKNPITRKEVLDAIQAKEWPKLSKTMLNRLVFGTAGLRGRMAAGYTCMNDVVVLQTAQGLCSYIQKACNQSQLHNGVVVGYDGRYNSKRFAELTAKVFVSASIPVHLFSAVCPTPLVSFATIQYHAAAGVMVTASHNPKEDNGYKVYWSNGSQIIAPHDQNILDEIQECTDIPDEHWEISDIRSNKLVKDCQDEVTTAYMAYIKDTLRSENFEENKKAGIKTVYTAMHGVGYDYVVKAFETANLKMPISVKEQQDPDPEFPTVKFPNPEELQCLQLGQELALKVEARLLLANDPDADRLAVAEYNYSSKNWKIFSGNEMGALLGWWLLRQFNQRNPAYNPNDAYVIASIVSSRMLAAIAKGKAHFVQTLTGFKWMGNTTLLLEQQGKLPLFAFEEAIGYMCDPRVPDKDGVSAAVQVASLASHLYGKGSSLLEQLNDLYCEYGFHISHNSYYHCNDGPLITKIFRHIRNFGGPGMYPKKVAGQDVIFVNDFTKGVKVPDDVNEKAHLNVLGTGLDQDYSSGEMIMFRTSDGLSVTVRTSGTEPKIKYYTEFVCKADTPSEQESMRSKVKKMAKEIVEELLQVQEHSLAVE